MTITLIVNSHARLFANKYHSIPGLEREIIYSRIREAENQLRISRDRMDTRCMVWDINLEKLNIVKSIQSVTRRESTKSIFAHYDLFKMYNDIATVPTQIGHRVYVHPNYDSLTKVTGLDKWTL